MALISKICWMFLAWMGIGAAAVITATIAMLARVQLLDPHNEDVLDEFFELAFCYIPGANGIRFKGRSDKEIADDIDDSTGSNTYISAFKVFAKWPSTILFGIGMLKEVYQQMKDEYDRGIRVRKEPS